MKSIKNKYLFFLFRILKDLVSPTLWPISTDLKSKELGEYYFVFDEKIIENQKGGQKSIISDADGIPMNPTYIDVKDKIAVYFPITIGQVGLAIFHTWMKTKADSDLIRFLNIANWFTENAEFSKTLGVRWLTDVALPQYKNPGPWQSAFSQSRGISVLLRAYQCTKENKYLDIAEQALIPFSISVEKGGVTSYTEFGPFYEEYTANIPTLVLNGMIFSLCGITDFYRINPDHNLAKELYQSGINTLKKILPEYDLGYWSRYNLCKADWYPEVDPATITYQHLHVTQLAMLFQLTDEFVFREFANKFNRQINLINTVRMYINKYKALKSLGRL